MFDQLVEKLKASPKKIVFTEGSDPRILEAAARLKAEGFLTPVLIGNVAEVEAAAKAHKDVVPFLEGKTVRKVIVVKNIVNIVVA